jgi:hypothetical protein
VVIYSESGPLAGDLSACLVSRFIVERVTSLKAARSALETPSVALLIVPSQRDQVGPECLPLVRRALGRGCRVLLLGQAGFPLGEDLEGMVRELPTMPSPEELFAGLKGLAAESPGHCSHQAGRAQEAEGS